MKFADVPQDVKDRLKTRRYDKFVEKHEGPWDYEYLVKNDLAEFLMVDGQAILLPIAHEDGFDKITVNRCIASADGNNITLFLRDRFYSDAYEVDEEREKWFYEGFVAICERFEQENFFIALVYHSYYIVECDTLNNWTTTDGDAE